MNMNPDEIIIDEMIKALQERANITYQEAANQVENLLENISEAVDIVRAKRTA